MKSISLLLPILIQNDIHKRYFYKCIRSIANQLDGPDEIIIFDDSLTDHAKDIVSSFHFPTKQNVFYYHNKHRAGLAANYNRCLEKAQSDYVYFFAQDEAFVDSGSFQNIRKVLNQIGLSKWCILEGRNQFSFQSVLQIDVRLLLGVNNIGGLSSILSPRHPSLKLDENLTQLVDTDLMFRLAQTIGQPLAFKGPFFIFGSGEHQTGRTLPEFETVRELRYLMNKYDIPIREICNILNRPGPREHKLLIAQAIKGS